MKLIEMLAEKEYYLTMVKKKWQAAGDSFPEFLRIVPPELKASNDEYVLNTTRKLQEQLHHFPRYSFGRRQWKNHTLQLIQEVLYQEDIIGLHHVMEEGSIDYFQAEIFEFLQQVRLFSPELDFYGAGQALRNYIVFAMFKKLHNRNSGFHLPAFGYSMLYPFTDNYIDNIKCTQKEKQEYNQLIRDQILGRSINPKTKHHSKTCQLLQAIENQYHREQQTGIQELLLFMLEAQEISIKQQSKDLPLSPEERLNISVYKGGISVLIDRFFVDKELTEADFIFYLSFGYFLQLADDLQDIKEDSEQGRSTIFTQELQAVAEEKLVNQLFCFLQNIMEDYKAENAAFQNFILYSSQLLILSSVLGSEQYFSKGYLERLENYLPISSSIIKNYLNNQLGYADIKMQKRYQQVLDYLIRK